MTIVEKFPLDNGAHRNQTIFDNIPVPDGWAIIPDGMDTPNFPFGSITVDESVPPMVTSWTAGTIPEPDQAADPAPTAMDRLEAQVAYTAMMTDTLLMEG